MSKNNAAIAEAYYTAVGERNVGGIEKYLHPDVQFIGPLAKVRGREAFLEVMKNFVDFLKTLKIRATFGSEDQAIVVYDVDSPVGNSAAASLMTFEEGLIIKIEVIYDARPYEKRR
jgi:hypothetical protein